MQSVAVARISPNGSEGTTARLVARVDVVDVQLAPIELGIATPANSAAARLERSNEIGASVTGRDR